jgi:hypothetical protein
MTTETGIGTRRPTFEERLAFMDEVRAMSEEELAAAYLIGRMDIVDQAWWTRHWQWRYSLYRDHLCYVNEAVQLLAWEANPPTLDPDSEDSFCRLARLNAHARLRGCDRFLRKRIYWLKREAIDQAMDAGLVRLRKLEWLGHCNRCDGKGNYYGWWWNGGDDAPEVCRRCKKGIVSLRFIECTIADRFVFHQPYDSTNPFKDSDLCHLEYHPALSWGPNRPGSELDADTIERDLAVLKRCYWDTRPRYVKEIYKLWD